MTLPLLPRCRPAEAEGACCQVDRDGPGTASARLIRWHRECSNEQTVSQLRPWDPTFGFGGRDIRKRSDRANQHDL